MFNPVSKLNWVYKYFFTGEPHKNTLIQQSSYKDNKFLDEMTRQNLEDLASRNPAYYKIYALGEFATLDKLVFPKHTERLISPDEVKHLPSYFGLDFGYINDPSALIHVKIDTRKKQLYIIDEYVKTGMLNDEIANVIKQLGYAKERITADSAEKKSIAEIKRKGIERIKPAMKGADSIMSGIQFISQFDIIVDERCTKTIEELNNYTWKKDKNTDEYYNEPVDTYNHSIDALRYSVEELMLKDKQGKKDAKQLRRIKSYF